MLLAPPVALDLVEVHGETTCPRAAEVRSALVGLLPALEALAAPDIAELREDGGVVVVLRRASGEVIGEKRLAASLSCSARATTVAVVVAAWEARLLSDRSQRLPLPDFAGDERTLPSPPPVVAAPPAPVAVPVPRAQAPAPVAVPVPRAQASDLDASSAARAPLELAPGVALLGSFNGNDVALGARGEVVIARRDAALGGAMGFLYVGQHAADVGAGSATWRRLALSAEGRWRFSSSPIRVEARAGLALAVLDIAGRSFTRNLGANVLDPGALVGVRIGLPPWRVSSWLDLGGAWWPRAHELSVTGSSNDVAYIPNFEAFAGLGLSLDRLR